MNVLSDTDTKILLTVASCDGNFKYYGILPDNTLFEAKGNSKSVTDIIADSLKIDRTTLYRSLMTLVRYEYVHELDVEDLVLKHVNVDNTAIEESLKLDEEPYLVTDDILEIDTPEEFSITHAGFRYILENFGVFDEISRGQDYSAFLNATGWKNPLLKSMVPASNRSVPIAHNSIEYSEAINALENLENEIDRFQPTGNLGIENEDRILSEVKAVKELLKSQTAKPSTIQSVIYGSLIYLSDHFVGAPIGEAAKMVWTALKELLGIG